jgi:hypothetical protein
MSYQGIHRCAKLFEEIQKARYELMNMGAKDCQAQSGHQDVMLSHMLHNMERAIQPEWLKLTAMKIEPPKL